MTMLPPRHDLPDTLHERRSRRHPEQVYYLYVPPSYDGSVAYRLLVTVHGRSRGAERYAQQFMPFADRHRYVVVAPLFPEAVRYQELGLGGERADLRLMDLIDEVAGDLSLQTDLFDLFGYSGGGQFAHRFLYVHPDRLRSVVIGAPGTVTLPTMQQRWPSGVRGLDVLAGVQVSLEAIRRPRVLLVVGDADVTLDDLNQNPWAMQAGSTRLGRARSLHASWLVAGIEHDFVEVPGAGHGLDDAIVAEACHFLAAGL
jgi:poly(3-hydroxybutyrate) depolymerase